MKMEQFVEVPTDMNESKGKINRKERKKWSNAIQFILACIGFSVGITNIWRFPYIAYENGGGAFQVAYVILLVLVGIPIYIMEICIGQFTGKGPVDMWKCCPIGKGIGWAMMISTAVPRCFFSVLISYTFIYMASSFTRQLPWEKCEDWWGADENCYVRNSSIRGSLNDNLVSSTMNNTSEKEVASKQYWERFVLNINTSSSDGINNFSTLEWKVVLSYAITLAFVYLSIFKGIRSIGKIIYFSALFPYVILLVFLIQSVMLDGASTGLTFFFVPTWEKLFEINTWINAARQVVFSLGVGNGVLINLSSHNKFHNNFYKNGICVGVIDFLTSVIGSIVVFSVLGMLAKDLQVPISEVFAGGQGLAYITFPEAATKLPVPQFWCLAFFFMLFTLGLDSAFTGIESVLSVIMDQYPSLQYHKKWFYIISTILIFCAGLPFTTPGGHYLLILMDLYNAMCRASVATLEIVFIMWIYGCRNFCEDVKLMLGSYPSIYFRICWMFISPLTIIGITVMSFISYSPPMYGNYIYPSWAHGIGWTYIALALGQVPFWALIALYTYWKKGNICGALKPANDWGPSINDDDMSSISKENSLKEKVRGALNRQLTGLDIEMKLKET